MAKKTAKQIYFESFDYEDLALICRARGIEVTEEDTEKTLVKKLLVDEEV